VPAWAVSIHKCQGQTLDHLKVDLGNIFEYGKLYVYLLLILLGKLISVAGHCVTTGGQVSLTNKIFVIKIRFYMKK